MGRWTDPLASPFLTALIKKFDLRGFSHYISQRGITSLHDKKKVKKMKSFIYKKKIQRDITSTGHTFNWKVQLTNEISIISLFYNE